MKSSTANNNLHSCHCCGLIQKEPESLTPLKLYCARCGTPLNDPSSKLNTIRAHYAALAALIVFPAAISMDAMEVEQLGQRNASSILSGMVQLFEDGHYMLGLIILVCSVILPLAKISGIYILGSKKFITQSKHKAFTYRMIEYSGRWGMIDVLLIASLVALLKLGDLVNVSAGPGAIAFASCVIFSLIASYYFDPHSMWKEEQ